MPSTAIVCGVGLCMKDEGRRMKDEWTQYAFVRRGRGFIQPSAFSLHPFVDLAALLRGGPFDRCRETRLVTIGGVVLDDAALGRLVDLGEAGADDFDRRIALGDGRPGLLQRRAEARLTGAVPRVCLFGLTSLLLGRTNIRHECAPVSFRLMF